ncbi:EAL domain-containing protein [Streptomyces massasporeus]|uniref:putative bifunctional diguanylate cyclase/phosphodiesterase n=1 Tax=Streptomyces massasporeus TaxID=67324 RepID=UPI0033F1576A
MQQRYRTLGAIVALDVFTIADVVEYSGVKENTVRTVIARERAAKRVEDLGEMPTGRAGGRPKLYRVVPDVKETILDDLLLGLPDTSLGQRGSAEYELPPSVGRDLTKRDTDPGEKHVLDSLLVAEDTLLCKVPGEPEEERRRELIEFARVCVHDAIGMGAERRALTDAHLTMTRLLLALAASEEKALEERGKTAGARRTLAHLAFHDPLTGLANRELFEERVSHALVQAQREGTVVGVLFLDIDDFKVVNDIHGYGVGNELLVALALRLQSTVRAFDTVARIGGDEFAILVEGSVGPEGVERLTEHVMTAFAEPFQLSVGPVSTYASIGVATTEDSIDLVDLQRHADLALYAAKTAGKRQWHRYRPELQSGLAERTELQEDLANAPIETSFVVLYQPIVELTSGRIKGFEALIRWPHSTRGMVMLEQFITLAEESGQIVPLGAWVLKQATVEAVRWQESARRDGTADGKAPYVSVNVSPLQFRDAEFSQVIQRALDLSGIEPSSLVLELTESVLMYNDERVLAKMRSLTDLGIRIAIDDFGTGYSSLSYLREFPISILKIDKSFVGDLVRSPEQYALIEGITHLAHTLGLTVIAEGVDNVRQQELLISMGCRLAQGHLFAEPVTAEEAEHLVLAPPFGRLTGLPPMA